jgi:hypothetical protein
MILGVTGYKPRRVVHTELVLHEHMSVLVIVGGWFNPMAPPVGSDVRVGGGGIEAITMLPLLCYECTLFRTRLG